MVGRPETRRLFRTVLFTDIVGSTEMAAQLGDRRWRKTVARHNATVRRELRRHHGREIDTAGDGFFATFESPTDAVRCAASVLAAVHGLGLRIRAGIHTGEVEPAGDKVGGIAVHIGARLLAMAGPEEVLVSSTVRDLVAGSGHEFDDRGEHELKGVPGKWHVYAFVLPRLDESIAVGAAEEDEERLAAAARRQRLVIGGLVAVIALLAVGAGAATGRSAAITVSVSTAGGIGAAAGASASIAAAAGFAHGNGNAATGSAPIEAIATETAIHSLVGGGGFGPAPRPAKQPFHARKDKSHPKVITVRIGDWPENPQIILGREQDAERESFYRRLVNLPAESVTKPVDEEEQALLEILAFAA